MKEKKKKVMLYITLGIIAIGIIALTVTYAYWRLTKEQTKKDVLQTGCFNINFTGENDITLNKAYPMKPDELENFLSTDTPYHFTIENTCDNLATATINLESLNAGAEKQLNDEYIDAILYETDYHNNLNSEKNLNENMYNDENKVISSSLHAYELYNFVLQKGETKSFNLLLYMDPDTPMETANMNATWKGKITLSTEYKEEPKESNSSLASEYITELAKTDSTNLWVDDTSEANIRYVGATVNNYIDIGDRDSDGQPILWRIIGVMNKITNLDNGETQESLVKIIRAESIGEYSWDSSVRETNSGYGVNEWSQADIMKLLNPNTVYSETPGIGGSLYWNRGSGSCYSSSNETNKQCEFTSSGISEEAKEKIAKVRWNTGTFATYNESDWTASATYEAERGNHNGKEQCTTNGGVNSCNDDVPRTTTWDGYIGLIYPSDFGYAVGKEVRDTCLEKSMYSYASDSCNTNNWLTQKFNLWTMTPSPDSSRASSTFNMYNPGYVYNNDAYILYAVLPVAYLKSSVKITSNPMPEQEYGTVDNPFQLIDTSL